MLRSAGVVRCGGYIDDLLITADTEAGCVRQLQVALDVIQSLGLPTANKITHPTQSIHFLGVVLDSVGCEVKMPDDASRILLSELASQRSMSAIESSFGIELSRHRVMIDSLTHPAQATPALTGWAHACRVERILYMWIMLEWCTDGIG